MSNPSNCIGNIVVHCNVPQVQRLPKLNRPGQAGLLIVAVIVAQQCYCIIDMPAQDTK